MINITNAIIRKSKTDCKNTPYLTSALPTVILKSVKLTPPIKIPISGVKIFSTRLETIFPKAAPIITPNAISITLPLAINSLNSSKKFFILSSFILKYLKYNFLLILITHIDNKKTINKKSQASTVT